MSRFYEPFITGPFQHALPSNPICRNVLSGAGPPEGVVMGSPGQTYIDVQENKLYLKIAGTQTIGWQLIGPAPQPCQGTGAGGVGNVYYGTANNPNGVITAQRPALYYSSQGAIWVKTNESNDNQGWVLLIA